MGSARYVGRVGGLAVALGIGTALLTGYGVASADSESSTPSPATAESTTSPSKPPNLGLRHLLPRLADLSERRPAALSHASSALSSSSSSSTSGTTPTNPAGAKPTNLVTAHPIVTRFGSRSVAASAPVTVAAVTTGEATKPLTGTGPSTPPPTDSPVTSLLLGAARREVGIDRVSYDPVVDVVDGVITGTKSTGNADTTYTVVGQPSGGGKVYVDKTTGTFSYLPYSSGTDLATGAQDFAGPEDFKVLVAQSTAFDRALESLPVIGGLVQPILVQIHRIPILGDALSPIIGYSDVVTITVDDQYYAGHAPGPIAFTATVTSTKDGTPISVNWFPAIGLTNTGKAPTILNGPSLATAGYIDPNQDDTVFGLVPGLAQLRQGYNVVTWDPRGEFASGGTLELDSPDYEAVDVSSIIDWVTTQKSTAYDTSLADDVDSDPNDPLIGMVGGSYGGGIQLTSAGIDPRIDVIAPGIAWNNLYTTLYPNHGFKTAFASLLLLSLVASGSRINPNIYIGIATGATLGILLPGQKEFLEGASPDNVVGNITAPTMFLQGTVDVLFPLQQAIDNLDQIQAAHPDVPVKMIWYCGGHGQCLDPVDAEAQTGFLTAQTMAWMNTYLRDDAVEIPNFQWVDQNGDLWQSDYFPTPGSELYGPDPDPIETGVVAGGVLAIAPLLGGSGPSLKAGFPVDLATASEAKNAINVAVPNPIPAGSAQVVNVVGSATLTLTYSGVGTSRNVYAQIVDKNTGRVVGNILTPISVTLDGGTHTTDPISLENIAYTMDDTSNLELQIVGTATPFENGTSYGVIDVKKVNLVLPTTSSDPLIVKKEDISFHSSTNSPPTSAGSLLGI
jgi:ABC-2 type transport system ATP-binding protein